MYPKVYLYKRIKDAKILIDRHYSEPIDLAHISEKVYLSKYHFLRLFKEAYGITPYQYLKKKRIEKAKELLSQGLSVNEVCGLVSFESVQSFSNLFKKETSFRPSEFRKHQRTNSNFR